MRGRLGSMFFDDDVFEVVRLEGSLEMLEPCTMRPFHFWWGLACFAADLNTHMIYKYLILAEITVENQVSPYEYIPLTSGRARASYRYQTLCLPRGPLQQERPEMLNSTLVVRVRYNQLGHCSNGSLLEL